MSSKMVNEQILNKLKALNLLGNDEEITESLTHETSWSIISVLLDTIQQKDTELVINQQIIDNYQNQAQQIQEKAKGRRRGLSLGEVPANIPTLGNPSSRSGSLAVYHNRPLSPKSPRIRSGMSSPGSTSSLSSPTNLNELDLVLEEIIENEQQVETEAKTEIDKLKQEAGMLQRKLRQKEAQAKDLIKENQKQSEELIQLRLIEKKLEGKSNRLQTEIAKDKKHLETLEREKKEANDDILGFDKDIKRLNRLLVEERAFQSELEKDLAREKEEKRQLRATWKKANAELLSKINEIARTKKLIQVERNHFEKIITKWDRVYEENQKKWETAQKKLVSSRSTSRTHSRNSSFHFNDQGIIFTPKHSRSNSFQTNSPASESELDAKKRKHQSTPLPLAFTPPVELVENQPDPLDQNFADLLKTLNDLVGTNPELVGNVEEPPDLADKITALETSVQTLNSELIVQKEEKQKLMEELGQVKYELEESKSCERNLNWELEQTKTKLLEVEELLKQIPVLQAELKRRETELTREKETLQDELQILKSDRDSQREFLLTNLVESTDQQLTKLESKPKIEDEKAEEDSSKMTEHDFISKSEETAKQLTNPLTSLKNSVKEFGAEIQEAQILINNWNLRNKNK